MADVSFASTPVTITLLGTALIVLGGCRSTSPQEAFNEVTTIVDSRLGHTPQWNRSDEADAAVKAAIAEAAQRELSPDDAVRLALIGNPSLQATFEELGIAQADLVQAGLLSNPSLAAIFRVPIHSGGTDMEFSLVHSLLELLVVPTRVELAEGELEQAKLRVADEVLRLAAEAKAAYADAQAAQAIAALRQSIVEADQAAAELAELQYRSGNISDLAMSQRSATVQESRLSLARAQNEATITMEQLKRIIGVARIRGPLKLIAGQETLPASDSDAAQLEDLARSERLDLRQARGRAALIEQSLELERSQWLTSVQLGVDAERDFDGEWSVGPIIKLELPIFDQRQAAIARLEALARQARRQAESLDNDVMAEVREAQAQLALARQTAATYHDTVIPLRQRIVALTQQQYNAMLSDAFDLLGARKQEIATSIAAIEARRDYWVARAELERAVGGRLPEPLIIPAQVVPMPSTPAAAEPSQSPAPPDHEHQHHH